MNQKWDLVNFCEIDKYAVKSYCAVHNVDENINLGDITKIDTSDMNDFTMMCGGSPCQDFSLAGNQKGSVWTCTDCGHEYNPLEVHWSKRNICPVCSSKNIEKTRSSLLVEYLRVLREKHPKFALYENVKNIVGKKFKSTFDLFIKELHEYGYNTYYKVLNAKDYGVPQNRERVYIFIVDKNLDNGKFKFPEGFDNGIRLRDVLDDVVEEKYYLKKDIVSRFITSENSKDTLLFDSCQVGREGKSREYNDFVPTLTSRDYKDPRLINQTVLDSLRLQPIDKSTNDTREIEYANCITAREDRGISNRKSEGTAIIVQNPHGFNKGGAFDDCTSITRSSWQENNFVQINDNAELQEKNIRIRKLIPKECWRLMGFSDNDFTSAQNAGVSNSQLYKQAGNSIVTDVLLHIYNSIYAVMPYLFDNLTLTSLFSGIGAFETALDRFFEQHNENFIQPQQR